MPPRSNRRTPLQMAMILPLVLIAGHDLALAQSPGFLDPNAELMLDARLDERPMGMDILGYQRGELYYISLTELMEAVQFPIQVNASQGMASGWYIRQDRIFTLNLKQGEVISGQRRYPVGPEDAVVFQNDIFVNTTVLNTWLPLQVTPNIRQLSVNIASSEVLPIQARLARQMRSPNRKSFATAEPEAPLREDPYRILGHHSTDIRLTYSNNQPNRDADTTRDGQYSLLSRGDLGWMTSSIALSGTNDDELSSARLNLERTQFEGPLGIQHVEVGDINPQSSAGNARGALIRGGNAPINSARNYANDTVDLRGDILPDWEVELYRNGILIDTQIVGPEGQYEFLAVPLVFGENVFEFVFYSPFGEERRDEVRYFASDDLPGAGQFRYEFAASQAGRSVFDLEPTPSKADRDSGVYSAAFNLGLTRNLSVNASVQSLERERERLEYYSAGLGLGFAGLQARTSYNHNPDDLDSYDVSLLTRVADIGVSAGYTGFTTSGLEPAQIEDNRALWNARLGLTADWLHLPMNLDMAHAENEFTTASFVRLGATSRFVGNSRLSLGLTHDRLDERELGGELSELTGGSLNTSVNISPWIFRAGIGYDIAPTFELANLNAAARLRIDRNMTMTYDVMHRPQDDYTAYSGGFNWRLQHFTLSPRISYDSDERYFGQISLSTSLATRPGSSPFGFDAFNQANSGGVYSRVFVDNDGDGTFSAEDEPLPGARLQAAQAFRESTSTERGEVYLSRLPAYQNTDILLDEGSVIDADLRPARAPVSVRPRPGHWATVDVPMVRTTELEGSLVIQRANGEHEPVQRVLVQLLDDAGNTVAVQRTAFDGLFLFAGLSPGRYRLVLPDDVQQRLTTPTPPIMIGSTGGISRLNPLIMQQIPAATGRGAPISLSGSARAQPPRSPEPASAVKPSAAPAVAPTAPIAAPTAVPASVPAPAAPPVAATSQWTLQLGAFRERVNAQRLWRNSADNVRRLANRPLQPTYVDEKGTTRLLLAPGMTESEARTLCHQLTREGVACMPRTMP